MGWGGTGSRGRSGAIPVRRASVSQNILAKGLIFFGCYSHNTSIVCLLVLLNVNSDKSTDSKAALSNNTPDTVCIMTIYATHPNTHTHTHSGTTYT